MHCTAARNENSFLLVGDATESPKMRRDFSSASATGATWKATPLGLSETPGTRGIKRSGEDELSAVVTSEDYPRSAIPGGFGEITRSGPEGERDGSSAAIR